MLYQDRKLQESRKNPNVLLSPRTYSQLILRKPLIEEKDLKDIMLLVKN